MKHEEERVKPLNIVMERYHDFCEFYMYQALPDHHFYVVDNNVKPTREFPPNAEIISWDNVPWEKIDLGYAVTYDRVEAVWQHNKPCVFHIDQVPQQWDDPKKLAKLLGNTPTCYWSKEEAEMWNVGYEIVRPHPIDIKDFKGYFPQKKSAITIATRAISGWGPDLKGYNILKDAYYRVPIQVIAKDDQDFPNARAIQTQEDMIKTLQEHQVYFNCAWKLDRSPLEAMAVGLPVVALRTAFNVYKDIFTEEKNNIVYAWNMQEMVQKTKELLEDQNRCYNIGIRGRDAIREHWSPLISRKGWEKAFQLAMK